MRIAARHLILPMALLLLTSACAGTSLREALHEAGIPVTDGKGGAWPDDGAPDTGSDDRDASASRTATAGSAPATRLATRPFFVAAPLQTGETLPEDRVPRAEFPEIQLSDALLYLLRNVTLRLAVDENLEDQTLENLVIEGSFADALDKLAQRGNFLYRRQGDVLHIEAAARYQIALPPVGYVGPKGRKDGVFALNPFDDLAGRLKKAGAQDVTVVAQENRITFTTSIAGRTPVLGVLDELRQHEEMIAFKLNFIRLPSGPLTGKSWADFSADLKPLALEGQPGNLRAYTGQFDAAAITAFLKALKQGIAPVEKGVALLPVNLPVTFSPAGVTCPAVGKGGSKGSKVRNRQPQKPVAFTVQTRRDGAQLRTNFSASLPGCAASDASAAFTLPTDQSIALVGLGGDLVLVLEPQLIRFKGAADPLEETGE